MADVTYYVGHEALVRREDGQGLPAWQRAAFAFIQWVTAPERAARWSLRNPAISSTQPSESIRTKQPPLQTKL